MSMIYVFGDCELDTYLYEFRKAGAPLKLEPKVFDVLAYLIACRERVVTKDELLTQLWPGQYISEATLNHAVMAARKATGDTGRLQRIIRTLRGRGYRFVASLEERESPAAGASASAVHTSALQSPVAAARPESPATGATSEPATSADGPQGLPGERKPVTVLSCALANAADLMDTVGPDAVHHIVQQFFAAAEEQVRRYGGTITRFMDDGLLALFGAPIAYEDHARRAVLAAMGLQQHLSAVYSEAEPDLSAELEVRIGLHTGLVLIGSIGVDLRMTSTAIAGTTDLAVRCQEHAPVGSILVSESTRRLIRNVVRLEPGDAIAGVRPGEQVTVYRVVARRRSSLELGHEADPNQSPFVGRDRELAALHALMGQVEEGAGQVAGLVAEPGMGKSRLLREFCRSLDKDRALYLEGHCLSYGSTTPYLPIIDVLRQAWGIVEGDSHDAVVAHVQDALQQAGLASEENIAYLLHLLGVQDARRTLSHLTPDAIKSRTFALLRQLCFAASRAQALIIAVEDLHWIDPTSEEFLNSLVQELVGASILLLTTYRPGYQPSWMGKSYTTQIALARLTSQDSLRVVQSMQKKDAATDLPAEEIIRKAAGNPFFLEELTQALSEPGAVFSPLTVPDTIQAVLAARIDRLAVRDKQLLQTAAVIGKDVPRDVLHAIAGLPESDLDAVLMSLQTAEFLHEKRDVLEPVFTFKHVLTQEVAYQSLLASTRRQLHQRIAQVLEAQPPETLSNQLELLAHHYTEAGLHAQAVDAWRRAGQRAIGGSAYREAVSHFTWGLAALETLPQSAERLQTELTFQLTLGTVLMATQGYAAPEAEQAYRRAQILCDEVKNVPQRIATLVGLWGVANTRAEHEIARELATQCLALTESLPASAPLLRSHLALGMSLFYLGELALAQHHLEQSVALYDHEQRRQHVDILQNPRVSGLANMAFTLWLQGYPEAALARTDDALAMARELEHPFSLAFALVYATALHQHRRDPKRVAELAEELSTLAVGQGFAFFAGPARIYRGWARAEAGETDASVAEIRQGLEAFQATQAKLHLPHMQMLLVEGYRRAKQIDAGLAVLQDCRRHTEQTHERWSEAELDRLEGDLLLRQTAPDEGEAEARFHRAIAIAQHQGAKMLELRAAVSLCRLWHRQGKKDEGRQLLSPLYKWFTEGHDTVDLRAAKALLDT
jgi:class 3 adenylate cyclase/predicted ATPase